MMDNKTQEYMLSICIPSRNEEWLSLTVRDILKNKRGKTEVIIALDGQWSNPEIEQHPDVTVVYLPESIGQRAATNVCVRLSKAKWVAKTDAHVAFDEGFDVKLMEDMQDDWVVAPTMRNLHVFDLVCKKCGDRRYQGPTKTNDGASVVCPKCGGDEIEKDVVWIPKTNPQSTSFVFDSEPHFQYGSNKGQVGDLVESMSLQGSFFMMTRENYWKLDIGDESWGSWGSQGLQVACSFWLSGGKVMINKKTWFAHCFRTQGGNFGFPYSLSGRQVQNAKKKAKNLFFNNKWDKQIYPLSWLVDKFWPVKGWSDAERARLTEAGAVFTPRTQPKPKTFGVCYISDCRLDPALLKKCQDKLRDSFKGKIVSVTLKPTDFGQNVVMDIPREKLSIFKQILKACETLDTDYVFLCDDDCLYPPEHFDFVPPRDDTFYYDLNWWRVRSTDGFAVHFDAKQSNLLCANRELLIDEYRSRVDFIEKNGWQHIGYEPGTRSIRRGGLNDRPSGTYFAKEPSIDIRHGKNLTGDKWKKEDFRDPRYSVGWNERYDKSWLESKIEIK